MESFGTLADGRDVERVTLEKHGMRARIITRGAALQDLRLDQFPFPLVLGFDRLDNYLEYPRYFGANVGRVANRLANANAPIENRIQHLDKNNFDIQTLHGGGDGTGVRLWKILNFGKDHVTLTDHLADGHMGFQGALDVTLTYRIITGPALEIKICATSDRDSLCNFAHHSYFNLDGSHDILDHQLQIDADSYLPVDNNLIPTGIVEPVNNTPFDFRQFRAIAWQEKPFGYDHNFCLANSTTDPRPVARLRSLKSGLEMTVITTEPGLQVFDGQSTATKIAGHSGKPYKKYAGIALEPQCWPDAPNQNNFPNIVLKANDRYRQISIFRFQ